MRNYKLGFTTEYTMRDEPGGWFKPSRVIFTPNTVHHAVENNKRLCVGSTFWVFFHGSAELLARPFDRRSVTCKACLDQLEANRIVDLEAEVKMLREVAARQVHVNAQTVRTFGACYDGQEGLRQLLDITRAQLRTAETNILKLRQRFKSRLFYMNARLEALESRTSGSGIFPLDDGHLRRKAKRRG